MRSKFIVADMLWERLRSLEKAKAIVKVVVSRQWYSAGCGMQDREGLGYDSNEVAQRQRLQRVQQTKVKG